MSVDIKSPEFFTLVSQNVSWIEPNVYSSGFLEFLKGRVYFDKYWFVSVSFSEYLEYLQSLGITGKNVHPRVLVSGYLNFLVFFFKKYFTPEDYRNLFAGYGYDERSVINLFADSVKLRFGFGYLLNPGAYIPSLIQHYLVASITSFDGERSVHIRFAGDKFNQALLGTAAVILRFNEKAAFVGYFPYHPGGEPKEEHYSIYEDVDFAVFFSNNYSYAGTLYTTPFWKYVYLSNVFVISPNGYRVCLNDYPEMIYRSVMGFGPLSPHDYSNFRIDLENPSFIDFVGRIGIYGDSPVSCTNSCIFFPVLLGRSYHLGEYVSDFPPLRFIEDCRSLFLKSMKYFRQLKPKSKC